MIKNIQRGIITITSILFFITANAQTGPAGIGNATGNKRDNQLMSCGSMPIHLGLPMAMR